MHAPAPCLKFDATPATQVSSKCQTNLSPAQQINAKPLGGPHHCIGTGHQIADKIFRYLQIKCASLGGTLKESELAEAQMEFMEDFQFVFDQFEDSHARCMDASSAMAPVIFARGRMLSWLLFNCSRRAAAYAFSNEVQDFRGNWLTTFYAALSGFVRQYISLDAEARLTSAYVKASLKHGQTLTINRFLQELAVQNVLRECLRGFETPGIADVLVACLHDKLSNNIDKDPGIETLGLHEIAIGQMQKFLNRLPDEIRLALN